jgi:hypothetical protein
MFLVEKLSSLEESNTHNSFRVATDLISSILFLLASSSLRSPAQIFKTLILLQRMVRQHSKYAPIDVRIL